MVDFPFGKCQPLGVWHGPELPSFFGVARKLPFFGNTHFYLLRLYHFRHFITIFGHSGPFLSRTKLFYYIDKGVAVPSARAGA